MDINFIKEYMKGRLGELSSLDGAVIVGISLGAILLAPIVKSCMGRTGLWSLSHIQIRQLTLS